MGFTGYLILPRGKFGRVNWLGISFTFDTGLDFLIRSWSSSRMSNQVLISFCSVYVDPIQRSHFWSEINPILTLEGMIESGPEMTNRIKQVFHFGAKTEQLQFFMDQSLTPDWLAFPFGLPNLKSVLDSTQLRIFWSDFSDQFPIKTSGSNPNKLLLIRNWFDFDSRKKDCIRNWEDTPNATKWILLNATQSVADP